MADVAVGLLVDFAFLPKVVLLVSLPPEASAYEYPYELSNVNERKRTTKVRVVYVEPVRFILVRVRNLCLNR